MDVFDDRVNHRKYVLQDKAFTLFLVESHAVVMRRRGKCLVRVLGAFKALFHDPDIAGILMAEFVSTSKISQLVFGEKPPDDFFVNSIDSESAAGTMVRPTQEYLLLLILILGWR